MRLLGSGLPRHGLWLRFGLWLGPRIQLRLRLCAQLRPLLVRYIPACKDAAAAARPAPPAAPPPPVARGEGGDTSWGGGKGGGEERLSQGPARRGRRAVPTSLGAQAGVCAARGPGPRPLSAPRDCARGGGAWPHADEVSASPGLAPAGFLSPGSVSHLTHEGLSSISV